MPSSSRTYWVSVAGEMVPERTLKHATRSRLPWARPRSYGYVSVVKREPILTRHVIATTGRARHGLVREAPVTS